MGAFWDIEDVESMEKRMTCYVWTSFGQGAVVGMWFGLDILLLPASGE